MQYYDDAAGILRSIILSAIAPHRLATAPPQLPVSPTTEENNMLSMTERAATEEPNFLPYAAVDNSCDEVDDRWVLVSLLLAGHRG